MRTRRVLPGLVAAAVAATSLMTPSMAAAGNGAADAKKGGAFVRIISHVNAETFTVTDLDCAAPSTGSTLIEATGTSTLGVREGDTYVGTDVWSSCFYLHPDETISVYGEATFTGEIVGCGTGTIQLRNASTISAPDPVDGTRLLTGGAVFVPGSGTGGLAGVKGGFREETLIQPDLTYTDATADGGVICGK